MAFGRKIVIIIFILLPVILVAFYSFYQTRQQLIKHIYEERSTFVALSTDILREKLDHLSDIGLSLSTRHVFREDVKLQKWDEAIGVMKDVTRDFPYITSVFIADTNGTVRGQVPSEGQTGYSDQSELEWFKGVSRNWQPYLSGVFKRSEKPQYVVAALALPVRSSSDVLCGILVLQVDVGKLLQWSTDVSVGKSGFVYIVDQNGHVAANTEYGLTDSVIDYSSVPSVQKALHGEVGVAVLYNPVAGQERLSAFEQVPLYKWAVIVQQEAKVALSVNNSLVSILIFNLFVILLAAVLAWWVTGEISWRRRSEEERRKYAELVDNAHVVIRNMDDEIISWNTGMEKLYGWKSSEVIGKTTHRLFSTVFPIGLEKINEILLKNNEWQGELRHITKNGNTIYVSSHWHLHRSKKGEPQAILETNNDISDLKLTQENLRKSEEINRLLVANVKDYAIFMLDPNGIVVSWNSGAEYIKGYTAKEILGKSFEVFYRQEDILQREPQRNLEMAKLNGRYEKEGWRVRKDGSLFWANVIFTALSDSSGSLYGYSKITRDITERKKADDQLAFLTRQINLANDAIYTLDKDLKIKTWNWGAEKMYGYTDQEVIGWDPNILLKTEAPSELIKNAIDVIAEQDHWTGEVKRQTKSGNTLYISNSATAIRDTDGSISGYVVVNLDITRQKILREQVNHLAIMVENSTEAIITRGLDQRIISWNHGAEKMFGFSKKEAIGKTVLDLGYMRLVTNEIHEVERQIAETGTWQTEFPYYRKNGDSFFGSVTGNGIKDESGKITAYIFIIRDISKRKQLEDELKKLNDELEIKVQARTEEIYRNERRFRALIENNNDVIVLTDNLLRVFYRSPSSARVLGWTDEDRLNAEGTNNVHPDDQDLAKISISEAISHPGKPVPFLYRNLHKGGYYIWLEGVVINLLGDENVHALLFNFRNVTERIEAEQKLGRSELRFRSLIENSAEGISLLDADTNVLYRSPSAYKLIGDSPRENPISYTYPSDLDLFKAKFNESLQKPGIPVPYHVRYLHTSGYYFWTEGTFTNLMGVEGINAVVANYRDVTERVEAEEKLKKLNLELEDRVLRRTEQLKKTNEELEAFSYSVSHDLRGPLRAIIGFTNILEEDYCNQLDQEAKRVTAIIKSSTLKLGHLIDDLLNFSRMGRQELVKSQVISNDLVKEVITSMSQRTEKEIDWIIHPLPDVRADLASLQQVWVNLISNAIKYSAHALKPVIEIGSAGKKGQEIFYVKDNGVGFDEKYSQKLFKVFQRLHSTDDFEGTGIGLAIVEKVISKHGGKVWANAKPGNGACFYFSLPNA